MPKDGSGGGIAPTRMRRFTHHERRVKHLVMRPDDPAVVEGRTRYPAMRRSAADAQVLKSGHNQKKVGAFVTKGRWCGMPIYTLTLEERATCPRSCSHWLDCYGNKMHWAHRFEHGDALENRLYAQVKRLQTEHPDGFVVRLHILGDFYSEDYCHLWHQMLTNFPALRVFGYTAWHPDSPIGSVVRCIVENDWDRFAIRFSEYYGTKDLPRALTIDGPDDARDAIVCPAQTGRTDCCGTCGLCWQTTRPIAFLRH